jgi:cell wall-associated NlpC family hydrolase
VRLSLVGSAASVRAIVFFLYSILPLGPALAENNPLPIIRVLADGAGPSHIFWLTGPKPGDPGSDFVGVVDPLYSAIRFFSVVRPAQSDAAKPRIDSIGACAFPTHFSPWAVHHHKNAVVIEGMPVPDNIAIAHNAIEKNFKSLTLTIDRRLLESGLQSIRKAADEIEKKTWNPADTAIAPPCGVVSAQPGKIGVQAVHIAQRGNAKPKRTIILGNNAEALAPAKSLTVRARTGGLYWLYSARELEPAGDWRVVQISEGLPGSDGMARIRQRLLTFGADGSKPVHELSFDEAFVRSKIGRKPVAILPTGEVLAMGRKGDDKTFTFHFCGLITAANNGTELCRSDDGSVDTRADADAAKLAGGSDAKGIAQQAASASPAATANAIFERVKPYATKSWSVDAEKLSEDCRNPAGCQAKGQKYVPIRGIRLSRTIFTRVGAPYAQTKTLADVKAFLTASDAQLSTALEKVRDGVAGAPGNLDDDFEGEFGIDCSALVQIAWGSQDGDRLSTETLQRGKSLPYRCPNRIGDISLLKSGDAVGLNVKPGVNHVVLYAAELKFDGANTSWLVLESSSSCDGVCWSVYDPAFFNGWGLYRAQARQGLSCPGEGTSGQASIDKAPIPMKADEWRDVLRRRED